MPVSCNPKHDPFPHPSLPGYNGGPRWLPLPHLVRSWMEPGQILWILSIFKAPMFPPERRLPSRSIGSQWAPWESLEIRLSWYSLPSQLGLERHRGVSFSHTFLAEPPFSPRTASAPLFLAAYRKLKSTFSLYELPAALLHLYFPR